VLKVTNKIKTTSQIWAIWRADEGVTSTKNECLHSFIIQKLELWQNEKVQFCWYDDLWLIGKQNFSHNYYIWNASDPLFPTYLTVINGYDSKHRKCWLMLPQPQWPWGTPKLLFKSYKEFSLWGLSGWHMKPATYHLLDPSLRMFGDIHPLPSYFLHTRGCHDPKCFYWRISKCCLLINYTLLSIKCTNWYTNSS